MEDILAAEDSEDGDAFDEIFDEALDPPPYEEAGPPESSDADEEREPRIRRPREGPRRSACVRVPWEAE